MKFIISFFKKILGFPIIESIGRYFLLMNRVFKRPEKMKMYRRMLIQEIDDLGNRSIGLVIFVSLFVGAVAALQMQNQLGSNPFVPDYYIGYATREILIMEFSPTMISIILAGKIGSFIASSIGSMRVTEQIDALDIMGINSASYLILPKIIAGVTYNFILIMLSIFLGIIGGYFAGEVSGLWAGVDYISGVKMFYDSYSIVYSLTKAICFAFVIITVSSYHGYYVKGGALEVGRASTNSLVWTIVIIIILDLLLTQLMLG